MGFYSIYKIIKDMITTLFGKYALKLIIICVILSVILFALDKKTQAYSTSDTLTFTFQNANYTLPSWIEGHRYAFFLSTNVINSNHYDILFILFDDNNNEYLTESILDNSRTLIESSGSTGFHVYKSTILSNLQSVINSDITYNNLMSRSLTTYETLSQKFFELSDNNSFLKSTVNIVNKNTNEPVYSTFISPTLSNTQTQLENLSFSNFIINANSFTDDLKNNNGLLYMLFYNRSLSNPQTTEGLYPIKEKIFVDGSIYIDYENSTDDNLIFSYPIFKTGVMFNVGSTYEIKFAKVTGWYDNDTPLLEFFDNSYTFTISSDVTQDYINELNQQTATSSDEDNNKELQDKIDNQTNAINNQTNAINNQTQSIDNINNSITDSSVDNSSIDLPTDNTSDPTQSGVDNIFQTIYNSFTSGTAQDIVFPIPFTNKSITLQANYIYNMLNNNGASWIITIIQAFWWYLISRFIIKDIMGKIRKIKQGNFENIQNSNIKEDML